MDGARLRRLGVIGDVHAEDAALQVALEQLARNEPDATLCVGDIVDGPGDVDRCCELLREARVLAVRGNHDRWILQDEKRDIPGAHVSLSPAVREYLEALPVTREFDTVAGRLMLCHGIGDDDMAALTPHTRGYGLQAVPNLRTLMLREDLALLVGGHTHERMVRPFPGLTVVNVGTLLRSNEPCFAHLDLEQGTVRFYDLEPALRVTPGAPIALPTSGPPSAE